MIHTEKVDLLKTIILQGKDGDTHYDPGIHIFHIWLSRYLIRKRLAIYPKKSYTPKHWQEGSSM